MINIPIILQKMMDFALLRSSGFWLLKSISFAMPHPKATSERRTKITMIRLKTRMVDSIIRLSWVCEAKTARGAKKIVTATSMERLIIGMAHVMRPEIFNYQLSIFNQIHIVQFSIEELKKLLKIGHWKLKINMRFASIDSINSLRPYLLLYSWNGNLSSSLLNTEVILEEGN